MSKKKKLKMPDYCCPENARDDYYRHLMALRKIPPNLRRLMRYGKHHKPGLTTLNHCNIHKTVYLGYPVYRIIACELDWREDSAFNACSIMEEMPAVRARYFEALRQDALYAIQLKEKYEMETK